MAVNSVTSNMPRFEIVKVEPMNSSGLSFRSRARVARSLISAEMSTTCFWSAFRTTGVMSPSGIETATPTWTSAWVWIVSPVQDAFTVGKRVSALAQAFTTRSLKETLTSSARSSCSRSDTAASMSISTVT